MRCALKNEWYKGKHAHIWLIPLVFMGVVLLWQTYCNQDLSVYELSVGYTYLLYQFPIMNGLMLPLMLAVLASRLCEMEIKGDTMKQLYTLQSKRTFYCSKFIHESGYLLCFIIGECLVILFFGNYYHYTDILDWMAFFQFGISTLSVGLLVLLIQHFLSLIFANQIIPLFIGLSGSFLGLFSMFLPHAVSRWILYGYFAEFLTMQMHWNEKTREIWFTPIAFPILKYGLMILFGIVLFAASQIIFTKQEV